MDSGRWRDVERVLDLTLDSHPEQWARILDDQCSGDPELRREVESLLGRYASAKHFLESPPAAAAAALIREARTSSYTREVSRVGVYRIVRQIGRGGTSLVFLAERDDGQFRQQVALKLLRPGHDSEIDQGRFRAERQILASLSHTNIARLLDGGVTDDGLPYIVMELVDGEPIDRYCESRSLSLEKRLEMFITVAEATQYAHQNLVVHRDLKPSNILVTADGQVKLLDFGLAKLLEPTTDAKPPLTTQRWMTPEYAAPEQVRGQPATTLTDVYQLGAVLYELLTGKLPFGTRERSPFELQRAIQEQDAPPPSAVALRPALRGDLDAIVLKALRKETEQRYASAQDFADDVRRHLSRHPVRARQGEAAYRALRFVRRHRWSVAASTLLLMMLTGYAVTLTMHARRVRATLARVEQERTKAEGSTQFLVGLFSANGQGFGPRDTLTAQQLLERGERQAESFRDQPLAYAQLLSVLGMIHHNLRALDRADTLLERALMLRRSRLGEEHGDVAETMFQLGILARSRGDYGRARGLFERALEIQHRVLGEEDPAAAETAYRLALLPAHTGDLIAACRQLLAVSQRVHGSAHPVVAENMMRLGLALRLGGLLDEAEATLRRALAMRQQVAPSDHRNIARDMGQLAILLKHKGQLAEAEQLHRAQLSSMEKLVGTAHPDLAGPLRTLAEVLVRKREFAEAEELARRDVAIHERVFGERHDNSAPSAAFLSWVLQAQGKLREAEPLRRRELAILRTTYGVAHPIVAGSLHNLAELLLDKGEYADAEQLLLEAKSIRERSVGAESPAVALLLPAFARLARERRDYAAAESLLMRALKTLNTAGFNDQSDDGQRVHRELAVLYEAWGKPDRAAEQRGVLLNKQ
jgi:tetratricopeptide (TPR) repeat protein